MVLVAGSDHTNTNIAFTVREVAEQPTLVATATSKDSIDILELAGGDEGPAARGSAGPGVRRPHPRATAQSNVISQFANLVIAEASAAGTELVGKTLDELDLRQRCGVSVVGVWERGSLLRAQPSARIHEESILLLAGTAEQLEAYNAAFTGDGQAVSDLDGDQDDEHVVVVGGGRVGRAVARTLQAAEIACRIVEQRPERVSCGSARHRLRAGRARAGRSLPDRRRPAHTPTRRR